MKQVQFEKVMPSNEQIKVLFDLLEQRLHRISCKEISYREHQRFVKSHPYRDWFLIRVRSEYVGSFYVSKENTIGINVWDEHTPLAVPCIINFVKKNFKPLPAIPSVRNGNFAINVPQSSVHLARSLEAIGARVAQVTYFMPG